VNEAARDRPAAIRRAVRTLVARAGFHGASMSAVAAEAGVAVGTAYVHYDSKEELLFAAYLEVKHELGSAASATVDPTASPHDRFVQLWRGAHEHLRADPVRAAFLVQFDAGPYAAEGHRRAIGVDDDPLLAEAGRPDLAAVLVDLPPRVLYDLAFGPMVRAVAAGIDLDAAATERLATASWRAVTAP
jgi:AcrR family transcriptional regulator